MAQEERSLVSLLPTAVTVLAVVSSAVVWHYASLQVPRPGSPDRLAYSLVGAQDVNARLWQDPFLAVDEHRKKHGIESTATTKWGKPEGDAERKKFQHALASHVASRGVCRAMRDLRDTEFRHEPEFLNLTLRCLQERRQDVVLIPVMVPGAPYVGAEETRRRTRYAVLSALDTKKFIPVDGEHIGFIHVPLASAPKKVASAPADPLLSETQDLIVPFETLVSSDRESPFDTALLIWIDEDVLRQAPLRKLSGVLQNLLGPIPGATNPELSKRVAYDKRLQARILGPASSTTLGNMIQEYDRYHEKDATPFCRNPRSEYLCKVLFLSPRVTASPRALLANRKLPDTGTSQAGCYPSEEALTDEDLFWCREFTFVRIVPTDEEVAGELVEELRRRYRGPSDSGKLRPIAKRMVLVSEWDTLYGRALPKEIMHNLGIEEECAAPATDGCPMVVSYLKGIDGALPGVPTDAGAGKPARDDKGQEAKATGPLEIAEGNNQYDYLRRLAGRVRERDRELRDNTGRLSDSILRPDHIEFVGVLGSDIYDKLSVLRALRDELPGAVFFTTDLDARMLQADSFMWTRNLIVGSGFGLALRPELQGGVPPFRDSYQSAAFLATLFATRPEQVDREQVERLVRPIVFEIGRTRIFNLKDTEIVQCKRVPEDCKSINPPDLRPQPSLRWLISGALGICVIVVSIPRLSAAFRTLVAVDRRRFRILRRVRRMRARGVKVRTRGAVKNIYSHFGLLILAVVSVVLFVWVAIRDIANPEGEPFALIEGVSVWPSQAIRLVAIVLAIYFLLSAVKRLRRNAIRISARYLPGLRPGLVQKRRSIEETITQQKHWFSNIFAFPSAFEARRFLDAEELWSQYRLSDSVVPKTLRIAVALILFVGFALTVTAMTGLPNFPGRGSASQAVHAVLLPILVLSFLILLFYVVDTTRMCVRWMREIAGYEVRWPVTALGAELEGVPQKYASQWVGLTVIDARTRQVSSLIYFPFIILFLLILARSRLFDDWNFPLGLAVVFLASFLYAIGAAWALQLAAEKTRRSAITCLESGILAAQSAPGPAGQIEKEKLATLLERVRGMQEGAFQPFLQQPAIKALLLPFGGGGGLALIEWLYLAKF